MPEKKCGRYISLKDNPPFEAGSLLLWVEGSRKGKTVIPEVVEFDPACGAWVCRIRESNGYLNGYYAWAFDPVFPKDMKFDFEL